MRFSSATSRYFINTGPGLSLLLAFQTITGTAYADDMPPSDGEAPILLETQENSPPATVKQTIAIWRSSLTLYTLGDSDGALKTLRDEVLRCGDLPDQICTKEELGVLYMCVGIVLSGGKDNHQAGVQAFKKGLSFTPRATLLPEYQTAPVSAAYNEAKTGKVEEKVTAAPTLVAANPTAEVPRNAVVSPSEPQGRFIFLGGATAKVGNFSSDLDIDTNGTQFGGSLVAAAMPGSQSGFTMGARLKGGSYLVNNQGFGFLSTSALLGSTIGKRRENSFFYFLGGLGVQYVPVLDALALVASFQGGASIGGFLVGGGVDFTGGSDVSSIMLGLEIGYGGIR